MKKKLLPLAKFEDEMGSSMIQNLVEYWLVHEQGFAFFLYHTSFTVKWLLNLLICIYMYVYCESRAVKTQEMTTYAANLFARFIFVQYQDFWKL